MFTETGAVSSPWQQTSPVCDPQRCPPSLKHSTSVSLTSSTSFSSLSSIGRMDGGSSSVDGEGAAMVVDSSAAFTSDKLIPVCDNPQLINQATSTQELQKLCFKTDFSLLHSSVQAADIEELRDLQRKSEHWSKQITALTSSRQGRSMQRWEYTKSNGGDFVEDVHGQQPTMRVRLVTGTVPILADGRILLVSSTKQTEWILPKGGWELDEELEESAIRESYEEAGVVGVLGPPLQAVLSETRKARKRRLSKATTAPHLLHHPLPSFPGVTSPQFRRCEPKVAPAPQVNCLPTEIASKETVDSVIVATSTNGAASLISPDTKGVPESYAAPISSSESTHTHTRLRLFPLYVQQVKDEWPESGRLRRALPLEQAIQALASRPQFHAALMEIHQRNMHIVADGDANAPATVN